ncbi:MAG: hypothetical protein BWZ02_00196 [Lentisphaerae bacterium ADurb.BinA184]|nr:MAG: hypothetical protein BWZ02_00196 [Lentisphaerae bacterium ADurb.BinA184]
MHTYIREFATLAALLLEGIATAIIVCGSLRALYLYATQCLLNRACFPAFARTRLRLGHALSLGLEFLIGADILKSAIAPTWNDLGILAAIVAIRSAINALLMWELKLTGAASDPPPADPGRAKLP